MIRSSMLLEQLLERPPVFGGRAREQGREIPGRDLR